VAVFLLSQAFLRDFGEPFRTACAEARITPEVVQLPEAPGEPLDPAVAARIEVAYLTRDWRYSADAYGKFRDAMFAGPAVKWVHFMSTGIDQHPFVPKLVGQGTKLTTSAGTNGEPVAFTAIASLLMLARKFPVWLDAQRRRAWEPMRGTAVPQDVRGQTLLVVGMGHIGATVARFAQALGMHVIGIRRSAQQPGDPVDEMHTLAALPDLLPRCDWIVLACPLTAETRRIINAQTIAKLKRGAGFINVARGGVMDQAAVIEGLKSGQIGWAHLDVFEQEPLPADSPLWDLPNVILTPHNAGASAGNDRRAAELFIANIPLWARGETLPNEFALE
jgi:phosphoglycerate dehydrogenase-like enzyme